jgi:excisionase family DNA binding protein
MTLLTLTEVARRIRCSRSHLYRILAGRMDMPALCSLRIGRRRFIRADALEDWLLCLEDRNLEAEKIMGVVNIALANLRGR